MRVSGVASVGDIMWVARDREGNEYVMNCILERKTVADLSESIRDGRYRYVCCDGPASDRSVGRSLAHEMMDV